MFRLCLQGKTGVAGGLTDLARSIDSTQIKSTQVTQLFLRDGSNDRVANTVAAC